MRWYNRLMESNGNGRKDALHFLNPPKRVVSLVPSMTESLFDLGLGEALVGITDYCVHPVEGTAGLPRLGGTKDPSVEEIIALEPDLVMANWEENTLEAVEALEAAGIGVWVTFPKTVDQSMEVLWKLVELFRSQTAAVRLKTLEVTLDWAGSANESRKGLRFFCPIWYDQTSEGTLWWMTFNQQTYPHDLLKRLGGENIFAERERRYPLEADLGLTQVLEAGERDVRYPCVTLGEIRAAQPELILLPDEPFGFDEDHKTLLVDLLGDTPAVQRGCVHMLDGSLITWHGTRLARALKELPDLLAGD